MLDFPYLVVLATCLVAQASPLGKRSVPAGVPRFVIDYGEYHAYYGFSPVVRLYSSDPYRPSDIGATLPNTTPNVNFGPLPNVANPLTLDNLDSLNNQGGPDIWLTSNQDVTTSPAWLNGVLPDAYGSTVDAIPGTVVVVDKGNGVVDAFYMYFYANNWGGEILNFNVGNHVGDWEHNVIRFNNGVPSQIWYSQHSNGEAFTYTTIQKEGIRPLVFSSNGSHANYATTGAQDRVLPDLDLPGLVFNDYADSGPRWDPVLNSYFVKYDIASGDFEPYDDATPTAWLRFEGKWGDQQYPDSDPRQRSLFGLAYKFTGGPTGPRDKGLNRKNICPDGDSFCFVRTSLSNQEVGERVY
ncbi:hypothetical protein CAC42_7461 [Sphaceloma murrayae]|uniref:Vacuolar protein sorting-associated protein 62 n=1 Tax=Sphaceloma murrayae TaxID=2082308 RepID=A0A2K1QX46_9PEZI|nr:hypothetical protein CAC42_7461 [Sphaceloma murrayae]